MKNESTKDFRGFHTYTPTEEYFEWSPIGLGEVPYCIMWKTDRQNNVEHESSDVLGSEQRTLQDNVGKSGILHVPEGDEGFDECHWWQWGC